MISTFLLLAVFVCLFAITIASEALVAGSSTAKLTYYNSYPFCCPKSPNYDPNAPTDECDDYSGCKYMGDFAAIGHKSIDYVKK